MNESSPDQKRPLCVRLAMYPSGPRKFHIVRCWLTIPVAISFCLVAGLGVYWRNADALQAHPRWLLVVGIFSAVLLLGLLSSIVLTAWLYFAVQWMDRNQQW